MAIIIEDGTIVDGANSYVTVTEARAFALARGVSISAVDSDVEIQLIIANDYLEYQRARFQGLKTNVQIDGTEKLQSLQWPRYGVYLDRSITMLDENTIPEQLKNAQCQLIVEQFNAVNLFPNQSGKFTIDERVGPLIVKYATNQGTDITLNMTAVENWLEPLFSSCGHNMFLKTARY